MAASPAQAAKPFKVELPLKGSATLAKPGQTLALPDGAVMKGKLNLPKRKLVGTMQIPLITTTMKLKLAGYPTPVSVTAKAKMVPIGKTVVNILKNDHLVTKTKFRIAIREAKVFGIGPNIVNGKTCTSAPIPATLKSVGKFKLAKAVRLKGQFTVGKMSGCAAFPNLGITDALLTDQLSGPGNSMDIMAGPVKVVG